MRTITDVNESLDLLGQYKGAFVQIVAFNIGLKRLLIKLSKSKDSEVLFVIVVGSEHINGPFSWKDGNVSLSQETDETTSEIITKVTDRNAGFELISLGGFALVQGFNSDFDESFINFSSQNSNGGNEPR